MQELKRLLVLEGDRRSEAERKLAQLEESHSALAEMAPAHALREQQSQAQLDALTGRVAGITAKTSGVSLRMLGKFLQGSIHRLVLSSVVWWRATQVPVWLSGVVTISEQVAHKSLRPAAEAMSRLRMHSELRQALESHTAAQSFEKNLEGELDDTRSWLNTALGAAVEGV